MRRRSGKDIAGPDLVIWGVPFDLSVTNRPGTRFGPQAIRRASAIFDGDPQYPSGIDPFARLAAVDYGDCALPRGDLGACARAIETEAAGILASGAHLVTLGGDHFITLPLLRAHVARHGKLALIQFDAHQDTWDDGPGGIGHGSFVLEAVREGLIDVERSVQIGIRTVAPRDCGIAGIDAYEAQELGVAGTARRIRERGGGVWDHPLLDIEHPEPASATATGTPVTGGLTADQALRILWAIRDLDIRGMDVVEVSPPYDHADLTAVAASSVAQHHIQALALKKAG